MSSLPCRLCAFWNSSIGKKILVALTGAFLVLFLVGHLAGNLVVFAGPQPFNDYAEFLHHMLHGAGIWAFRGLMLGAVAIHVVTTISLTRQNRAAREPYQFPATIQASRSSRFMIGSGLTVLAFLVYHLLHFTVRVGNEYDTAARYRETVIRDGAEVVRHNAWQMVIDGFSCAPVALCYVIAMTFLCSHLSHGVASLFQTLGLRSQKSADSLTRFATVFSAAIWLGFVSIPVAILLFHFGR
jgi:succinate dehydrogenase / fumarate reductase cytochrome b subunit